MRCKPNELAYVDLPGDGGKCNCYFGRTLHVRHWVVDSKDGLPYWRIERPWLACSHYRHKTEYINWIQDAMLCPIRPKTINVDKTTEAPARVT